MVAVDGVFRNDCYGLARRVIDDHQQLYDASRCDAVEHEVDRPHLVSGARANQQLPLTRRDFLATPMPHLQFLQHLEPLDALVVDQLSGLSELEVDRLRAVTAVTLRERHDLLARLRVAVRRRLVTL